MAQDVGLLIYLKTVIYIHIYMYCMRLLSQKLGLREPLFLILECVLSDPGFLLNLLTLAMSPYNRCIGSVIMWETKREVMTLMLT